MGYNTNAYILMVVEQTGCLNLPQTNCLLGGSHIQEPNVNIATSNIWI